MTRPYFDLFLIYGTTQDSQARQIAACLEETGRTVCLNQTKDELARSLSCAVLVGPDSLGQPAPAILAAALQRATLDQTYQIFAREHAFRVWPVLLPGLDDPFEPDDLPTSLANRPWLDLRSVGYDPLHLTALCDPLRATSLLQPPAPPTPFANWPSPVPGPFLPSSSLARRSPYPGLPAFERSQSDLFYGREAAIQRGLEKLKSRRSLAVIGPAGSGKSSLVQAGLVPALAQRYAELEVETLRPARWLAALTEQEPAIEWEDTLAPLPELALVSGATEPVSPPKLAVAALSTPRRKVLVVEQLEEIFTLFEEEATRADFVAHILREASRRDADTYLIVTLRSEYLVACAAYPELATRLSAQYTLGPLDPQGWQRVIEEPARRLNVRLEPGLVGAVLDDLAELDESGPRTQSLSLLQYSLRELWEATPEGQCLTLASYQEQGGLANGLARRAEEVFNGLNKGGQAQLRQILLHLAYPPADDSPVAVRYANRPAHLDELVRRPRETPQVQAILEQLIFARLIETDAPSQAQTEPIHFIPDEKPSANPLLPTIFLKPIAEAINPQSVIYNLQSTIYNLSSEAVVEGWPRLRQWVEARSQAAAVSRQLRQDVAEWQQHARPEHLLYKGVRLAQAVESLELGDPHLGEAEWEFIRLSQHRAQRAMRLTAFGLAIGLGVLCLIMILTFFQARVADQERDQARQEATAAATKVAVANQERDEASRVQQNAQSAVNAARSRELAADAVAQLDTDSQLALLLAIEAAQASPTNEARNALQQALNQPHIVRTFPAPQTEQINQVIFSSQGRLMAVNGANNTIQFWQVNPNGNANPVAFKPIGSDPLTAWAFSPDDRMFAYLIQPGNIHVIEPFSSRTITDITASSSDYFLAGGVPNYKPSLSFSPDRQWLLLSNGNGKIRLWHIVNQKFEAGQTIEGDLSAWAGGGQSLVTARDNTFTVWTLSPPPGKTLIDASRTYTATEGTITALTVSPDGQSIATAHTSKGYVSQTSNIWVWAVGNGQAYYNNSYANTSVISQLKFSPDGQRLAIVNESFGILDLKSGRSVRYEAGYSPSCFDFSPDGRFFISCTNDQQNIILRDTISSQEVATVPVHTLVRQARFSPDGRYLAIGITGNVQLWDIQSGTYLQQHNQVNALAFSPDVSLLATVSDNATLKIWNTSGNQLFDLTAFKGPLETVAFSPDGKLVAAAGIDKVGWIFPSNDTTPSLKLVGHTARINSIAFSPDGQRVVTASDDSTARIWQASDGQPVAVISHTNAVKRAVFSPDGHSVLTASDDNTAQLWQENQPIIKLEGHTQAIKWAAFSPDGKLIATASQDNTARLWDTSGKQLFSFTLGGAANMVAFSPDGSRLVIAGNDAQAYIEDVASGKEVLRLKTNRVVNWAAFSPDGTVVLTAEADGIARVWDDTTGQALGIAASHSDRIYQAAFSPDGKFVAAASADGTASLNICQVCGPTDQLLARAQNLARRGRQLTPQERQKYLHQN